MDEVPDAIKNHPNAPTEINLTEETMDELNQTVSHIIHEYSERRKKITSDADNLILLVTDNDDYTLEFANVMKLESAPKEVPKICNSKESDFLDKQYKVVGSIGYTYQEEAFDPTITEAFDTGFFTAIRMMQAGLVPLPEVKGTSESAEM